MILHHRYSVFSSHQEYIHPNFALELQRHNQLLAYYEKIICQEFITKLFPVVNVEM